MNTIDNKRINNNDDDDDDNNNNNNNKNDICGGTWYEHSPEPVVENMNVKILWDFTVQTDKKTPHNRPDIVVVEKTNKICHIINVACPGDCRIALKENGKVNKYRDVAIEIKTLWNMKKVVITPIVLWPWGASQPSWKSIWQKTVLLGSARILRRVLEC